MRYEEWKIKKVDGVVADAVRLKLGFHISSILDINGHGERTKNQKI